MDNENNNNIQSIEEKEEKKELRKNAENSFSSSLFGYKKSQVDEYIALINANLSGAQSVFDEQSEEFKQNVTFLNREKQTLEERIAQLEDQASSALKQVQECEELVSEAYVLKDENNKLQDQVNSLFSKLERCKEVVAENRVLKEKMAEVELFKKRAIEEKELMTAEIEKLRKENTAQAYDFAEQKKELEAQYLNANLKRAEYLQVHSYHIGKTDELLDEIVKQFKLALKSFEGLESTQ